MIIGIDASRYAYDSATGVEWYSKHIINGLISLNKEDEIVLYSREPLDLGGFGEKVRNKVLEAKRFWTLKRLSREMKENPPDVLFVPSHTLPLKLPGKNVITIHDVAFKYLRDSYSFSQYHYLDWSTKFAVKHASKIIVPSGATAEDLKHFYDCPEEKLEVIAHGFTPPGVSGREIDEVFKKSKVFQYFGIHKEMNYLLFVGRLESKKNLERVVEAFHEFSQVHSDFKLILAGKRGVGFGRIIKKINELKIADKLIMPGYIEENEKAALFKYSNVFVFTSLYEGFGLPLLEAFYYKKPVLSSRGGSIEEVAGDAAHYIDPFDKNDIAAGMDKLVNDPDYAAKLVEKGSERLKKFSWKKSAQKTLQTISPRKV